jgi:hypothetical protein
MGNGLGQFTEGVASWRRMLAAVSSENVEVRWRVFGNAAHEIAGYVPKGLEHTTAVDEVHDIAIGSGLLALDADMVQQILAGAFEPPAPADMVPDLLDEPQRGNGRDRQPATVVVIPTQYLMPDAAGIPPREWLSFKHYMRGVVTSTVAPGGFGKTTLALYEALEMVKLGLRVWYVSAEDDRKELDRRIAGYI